MSRPWSDTTKRSVVIGLALLGMLALVLLRSLIAPVAIAVIIAYILFPLVDAVQARTRLPRSLTVLLVDAVALVIVGIIPAIAAPTLYAQIRQIDVDLEKLVDGAMSTVNDALVRVSGGTFDATGMLESMEASITGLTKSLISGSLFLLLDVATALLWAVFVFAVSFYLMRDWHRVTAYLRSVVPPGYDLDYQLLTAEIGLIWQAFFRGQVLLSLVVGLAVAVLMAIVGVRSAMALGLLAGLLEVVPNVGPVVAAIPAVVLALFQGSSWMALPPFWFAILVVGIYVAVQQVENNYLVPRIIGGSVRLHPLVVLVGAIGGARLAGILGIFLAAPVLASARVILAYVYAKLLDVDMPAGSQANTGIARASSPPSFAWPHGIVVAWHRVSAAIGRRRGD